MHWHALTMYSQSELPFSSKEHFSSMRSTKVCRVPISSWKTCSKYFSKPSAKNTSNLPHIYIPFCEQKQKMTGNNKKHPAQTPVYSQFSPPTHPKWPVTHALESKDSKFLLWLKRKLSHPTAKALWNKHSKHIQQLGGVWWSMRPAVPPLSVSASLAAVWWWQSRVVLVLTGPQPGCSSIVFSYFFSLDLWNSVVDNLVDWFE